MYQTPDHPIIQNCERTGYPDGQEPKHPHCPVCFKRCSEIFKDKDTGIIGCNRCIETEIHHDDITCPVCGTLAPFQIHKDDSHIYGCDECITTVDAYDVPECFDQD